MGLIGTALSGAAIGVGLGALGLLLFVIGVFLRFLRPLGWMLLIGGVLLLLALA
jgi:hypothetical protein